MRIHELLAGHPLHEETETDGPGLGSTTPLATMAVPGLTPVDQELALSRLKPLRHLRRLERGALTGSDSAQP
jgi:hypothetical protein